MYQSKIYKIALQVCAVRSIRLENRAMDKKNESLNSALRIFHTGHDIQEQPKRIYKMHASIHTWRFTFHAAWNSRLILSVCLLKTWAWNFMLKFSLLWYSKLFFTLGVIFHALPRSTAQTACDEDGAPAGLFGKMFFFPVAWKKLNVYLEFSQA